MYNDVATGTNVRETCPIAYSLEPAGTPFVKSLVSGNEGYDGLYRVTLDTGHETAGSYEVTVKGIAHQNLNPFTVKFVLNLKCYCTEMAVTNFKFLNTPILTDVKYTHYDNQVFPIPTMIIDEMTPVLG